MTDFNLVSEVVLQEPFSLPRGLDLMMADVCGGSETPSMVRKVQVAGGVLCRNCSALLGASHPLIPNGTHAQVLAWRKAGGAAAAKLWADLGAANGRVEGAFAALHKAAAAAAAGSGAGYDTELQACASNTADKVLANWELALDKHYTC